MPLVATKTERKPAWDNVVAAVLAELLSPGMIDEDRRRELLTLVESHKAVELEAGGDDDGIGGDA